jgi:hypothetical protein
MTKFILVIGAVILVIMCSCASARLNESGAGGQVYTSGVSTQRESPQLPLPKATTCFTHHVTDSAAYMQCF